MIPKIQTLITLLCLCVQSSLAQAVPRQNMTAKGSSTLWKTTIVSSSSVPRQTATVSSSTALWQTVTVNPDPTLRRTITANSNSTLQHTVTVNSSTTSTGPSPSITPPPCCWILGGFQAVKVNSWYTTSAVQYTATVITTLLQYRDTLVIANASTKYLPLNETYTSFTEFGQWGVPTIPTVPGVPKDLVPSTLILGTTNYGATVVGRATDTVASFTFTDLQVPSPTPYAIWAPVVIYTSSANPATTCGTQGVVTYDAYNNGNWMTTTRTTALPAPSILSEVQANGSYTKYPHFRYVQTLPAPPPNDQVWIGIPDNFVSWLASDTKMLSASPWITDCVVLTGYGQPTAHVAVNQLTTDSTSVVTLDVPLNTPSQSSPAPFRVAAASSGAYTTISQQLPQAANTAQPQNSIVAPSSYMSTTTTSTESQQSSYSGQTNQAQSPNAGDPSNSDPQNGSPGTSVQIVAPGNPPPQQTFTLGDQTLTAIGGSAPQILVGSQTITMVSDPGATQIITINDHTYTAVGAGPNGFVLAGQTITVAATTATTTEPPAVQTVTVGDQTFDVTAAASTRILIDGKTLIGGSNVVVSGETLALTGTELVIASGTATTTVGLGTAVVNGFTRSVAIGSGDSTQLSTAAAGGGGSTGGGSGSTRLKTSNDGGKTRAPLSRIIATIGLVAGILAWS